MMIIRESEGGRLVWDETERETGRVFEWEVFRISANFVLLLFFHRELIRICI